MYQVWNSYYGEFLVLGVIGIGLTLVRRILFGKLYKDAALGSNGKGKMLKAMTLKFEKSCELKVGIYDIPVFIKKYLCQERRFGMSLLGWRRLPERWTCLILCVGIVEAMVLRYLQFGTLFVRNRLLAAVTAAAAVWIFVLLWEGDSLWERTQILLQDYVANTLYPRQVHVYETFEEPESATDTAETNNALQVKNMPQKSEKKAGLTLKQEEEEIFQEVLADLLG